MKLEIIKMLKMSAFYLEKQSSFIPKINIRCGTVVTDFDWEAKTR